MSLMTTIASFSRGDGGFGALMRNQREYLSLIVQQLTDIQAQLTSLSIELSKLSQDHRKQLREQYRDELITKIKGAVSNYIPLLTAYQRDAEIFKREAEKTMAHLILHDAGEARATLSETPDGRGPEAAMLFPTVCALESALLAQLGFQRQTIKQYLEWYKRWLDRMLGPESGSVPDFEAKARTAHQALLQHAIKDPTTERLAKSFGLADMTLNQNSVALRDKSGQVGCIVFATGTLAGDLSKAYSANPKTGHLELFIPFSANLHQNASSLVELGSLSEYVDPSINEKLLIARRGLKVTASLLDGKIDGFPPKPEWACFYVKQYPAILDTDEILKAAPKTVAWTIIDKQWTAFEKLVADLNQERVRVRFAQAALEVLAQAKPQLDARLQLLG